MLTNLLKHLYFDIFFWYLLQTFGLIKGGISSKRLNIFCSMRRRSPCFGWYFLDFFVIFSHYLTFCMIKGGISSKRLNIFRNMKRSQFYRVSEAKCCFAEVKFSINCSNICINFFYFYASLFIRGQMASAGLLIGNSGSWVTTSIFWWNNIGELNVWISSIYSVCKLPFTFSGNKSLGEVQYLSCQLAPTNGGDKSLEHTHPHSKPQQWVMALGIWQSPLSASTMGQKWVMTLCISHKTGPSKVEISLQKSFYLYDLLLQISVGLELFHWELDISYIQFTFVHTWLKGRVNVN